MLAEVAGTDTRRFRAAPEAIGDLDAWIESVGVRWGLDQRTLFRARLCISELATNIMEHGLIPSDLDNVILTLRHCPPGLEIELSDPGPAFNPVTAPPVEPDSDSPGGRGLHLVRSYAEAMTYKRAQDRNVVTFRLMPRD
jgi:anti-sigma regulatory factor (Ser/Thr protein kinase)